MKSLLDSKTGERPKEHVLTTPKKSGVKEKNKRGTQRKAAKHDLAK